MELDIFLGQAEPESGTIHLGSKKRFRNPRFVDRPDAYAVILDDEKQMLASCRSDDSVGGRCTSGSGRVLAARWRRDGSERTWQRWNGEWQCDALGRQVRQSRRSDVLPWRRRGQHQRGKLPGNPDDRGNNDPRLGVSGQHKSAAWGPKRPHCRQDGRRWGARLVQWD